MSVRHPETVARPQRLHRWLPAVLAAGLSLPATAIEWASGDVQLHGFAAQGWTLSDGNNINGHSDDSSGSFLQRELGASLSWRPRGDLLVSGQLASLRAGKAVDEDLSLEYAVLDWSMDSSANGHSGLRLGKLKLPFGFYNEGRDAVFGRQSVLLPQSVYLGNSGGRALGYFSLLGGGLYRSTFHEGVETQFEVSAYGPQRLGDQAEIPILRREASGRFKLDYALLARFSADFDAGRWRTAISLSSTELEYQPGQEPPFLLPGRFSFDQVIVSLQHNRERWNYTAEWVWRSIRLTDLVPGPFSSEQAVHPGGLYLQAAYRITPRLQAMLRYDEQYRDQDDRRGFDQSRSSATPAPRHYFFGRDWTLGGRMDLRRNVSLFAEFHLVDGAGWVNPLDNPGFGSGDADRYWHFFTVLAAYRF